MTQETRYPWDGAVKMTVKPDQTAALTIHVRIPGWARNEPVPSDLYRLADRNAESVVLKVNGKAVPVALDKGYVNLARTWKKGDTIELAMPMPVRRVLANDHVAADRGRVAIQRGPIVYAAEWVGQSRRQSTQPDAPRQRQTYCRIPARAAQGRGSSHRQGGRAGLRCSGPGGEARTGSHHDSLLRVGQSRPRAR